MNVSTTILFSENQAVVGWVTGVSLFVLFLLGAFLLTGIIWMVWYMLTHRGSRV